MLPVVWFPFLCTVLFSAVLVTLCVCGTTPLRKRTLSGCITAKAFQSSIIPFGTKLAHSGGHDEVESFCESEASHTDLPEEPIRHYRRGDFSGTRYWCDGGNVLDFSSGASSRLAGPRTGPPRQSFRDRTKGRQI